MSKYEICCNCGKETGRAGRGEDSIYAGDTGPFCPECRDNFGEILGEIIDKQSQELAKAAAAFAELQADLASAREALSCAIRAANLALFVIDKKNVMPNSSWQEGFKKDIAVAEAELTKHKIALPTPEAEG